MFFYHTQNKCFPHDTDDILQNDNAVPYSPRDQNPAGMRHPS